MHSPQPRRGCGDEDALVGTSVGTPNEGSGPGGAPGLPAQQCLYRFPLPHAQGSCRPVLPIGLPPTEWPLPLGSPLEPGPRWVYRLPGKEASSLFFRLAILPPSEATHYRTMSLVPCPRPAPATGIPGASRINVTVRLRPKHARRPLALQR